MDNSTNWQDHDSRVEQPMSRRNFLASAAGSAVALTGVPSLLTAAGAAMDPTAPGRPNILLVLADDMGFSDISSFGGEINTPNIDSLMHRGIHFTQFYNAARCCPSRASLLTGLYPHQVGMGWLTNSNLGAPGYTGDLARNGATLAELLGPAGYRTYMSGKWHLTHVKCEGPEGPKYNWPLQRGFHQFYGTLTGNGGDYFDPHTLTRGNEPVKPGKDFYYTDAISDSMIDFIQDHKSDHPNRPFFGYLSYTAPHWPLHALEDDIKKYISVYEAGWDEIRSARYRRLQESGLLDDRWDLSPKDFPSWAEVPDETKPLLVKRMAVYAAQIASMDRGIGRVVDALRKTGQLDNTLILFLSDNGGASNPISRGDKSVDALGTAKSFESYRREWANVSNTPFRMYKHFVHEGGIATPLIVHWPAGIAPRKQAVSEAGHIIDIAATCLDAAQIDYPSTYDGYAITPSEGRSLLPAFNGGKIGHDALYWEHSNNRAVRQGKWKLVLRKYNGKWELYDMEADRTEIHDLAAMHPDRVSRMAAMWDDWATRSQVYPLCNAGWNERISMDKGPPGLPQRP